MGPVAGCQRRELPDRERPMPLPSLYHDILAIARDYMGPAAEDYIRRRIRIVHRGHSEESVPPDKLERLAAGIDMSAKVYMSLERAARFRDEILALERRYPVSDPEPAAESESSAEKQTLR